MDVRTDSPCILPDIVPFGFAAQKGVRKHVGRVLSLKGNKKVQRGEKMCWNVVKPGKG